MGLSASAFAIGPGLFENDIRTDRKLVEALFMGQSGVVPRTDPNGDFLITPVAGEHSVQVTGYLAAVRGRNAPTSQGYYLVWSDGADVLSLPVPQANPYYVAVVLRVVDPQYGVASGAVGARYHLVPGIAAPSPLPPDDATITAYEGNLPGGWERIGNILINPGDSGAIPSGQISHTRSYISPNGFMRMNAGVRPADPWFGLTIYDLGEKLFRTWDGSSWRVLGTQRVYSRGTGGGNTVTTSYTEPTSGARVVLPAGKWLVRYRVGFNLSLSTQPRKFTAAIGHTGVGNVATTSAYWHETGGNHTLTLMDEFEFTGTNPTSELYIRALASATGGTQGFSANHIMAVNLDNL